MFIYSALAQCVNWQKNNTLRALWQRDHPFTRPTCPTTWPTFFMSYFASFNRHTFKHCRIDVVCLANHKKTRSSTTFLSFAGWGSMCVKLIPPECHLVATSTLQALSTTGYPVTPLVTSIPWSGMAHFSTLLEHISPRVPCVFQKHILIF